MVGARFVWRTTVSVSFRPLPPSVIAAPPPDYETGNHSNRRVQFIHRANFPYSGISESLFFFFFCFFSSFKAENCIETKRDFLSKSEILVNKFDILLFS